MVALRVGIDTTGGARHTHYFLQYRPIFKGSLTQIGHVLLLAA